MKQAIKKTLVKWFVENPVKNVLDMTEFDIADVKKQLSFFITDEIVDTIQPMSIADLYDMQAEAAQQCKCKCAETKTVCEKEEPAEPAEICECEVKQKKSKRIHSRIPKYHGKFYARRSSISPDIDPKHVYQLHIRLNGERVKPLFAVIDPSLPLKTAKAQLKTAYAKKVNTNYLNVSLKLADFNNKGRAPKKDTKWFGEYYVPVSKR